MLYEYLKQNYKEGEPIFFSDLHFDGVSKPALNQMFKQLCDEKKISKYDTGLYSAAIPTERKCRTRR